MWPLKRNKQRVVELELEWETYELMLRYCLREKVTIDELMTKVLEDYVSANKRSN